MVNTDMAASAAMLLFRPAPQALGRRGGGGRGRGIFQRRGLMMALQRGQERAEDGVCRAHRSIVQIEELARQVGSDLTA